MWKPEQRLAADRRGLRYPSDLTDAEWAIVAGYDPARLGTAAQTFGERARCCCIHPPCHDPHHAQATRCKCLAMNPNVPDGFSAGADQV
jgi:hypothetical protein